MPAAQDKIVYLYFICNCIVKSVAYVLMFSCIVYLLFYYLLQVIYKAKQPVTSDQQVKKVQVD